MLLRGNGHRLISRAAQQAKLLNGHRSGGYESRGKVIQMASSLPLPPHFRIFPSSVHQPLISNFLESLLQPLH